MGYRGYAEIFPSDVDADKLMVDGSGLLQATGFWAAHYLSQTVEDDSFVDRVWGLDRATVRAIQDRLNDSRVWPTFEVELRTGGKVAVVYRNLDEDAGVDYLVVPADGSDCVRIATTEGEYEGPGISWAELTAAAGGFTDPVRRAEVLLLLAPVLGDVEAEDPAAITQLADSLRLVNAVDGIEDMARMIASENVQWEPAVWYTAESGATCCDGESSPRNPEGAHALADHELITVSGVLGGSSV